MDQQKLQDIAETVRDAVIAEVTRDNIIGMTGAVIKRAKQMDLSVIVAGFHAAAEQETAEDSLTVKECTIAPDFWQQQVFELCNDIMAYFPMTEAMMTCMYKSTGDRRKYPNAADWLARAALSAAQQPAAPASDELSCEDIERLRLALSWEGYSTPEGLENCAVRWPSLVRDLISGVLDRKKRTQDAAAQPPAVAEGCGACGDGCNGQGCRLERESPPTCQTCNGKGMIGGLLPNGGGYDGEPCPDCSAPQATAEDSSVVQADVAVPGGYKLVPIKPTDLMLDAAVNAGDEPGSDYYTIYAAMLAAAPQAASESPAQWPQERDVGRIGDMSQVASLRVGLDADNDVYVSIANEEGMTDVEFCVPGSGGGKSPRTRAALISLMVAMEADNAETPSRDWWKAREGDAQKGGAA